MKAVKYVVLFLLIIQLGLPYAIPMNALYHNRIDYNVFKDNVNDYYSLLKKIKTQIQREHLDNYIIILGDSVAYSSPGDSQYTINHYMEQFNREAGGPPLHIFNLAMPAMQSGDLYTMLLMLDDYGISTDHVMLNVRYAGFVARNPDPPPVFWLADALKKYDPVSFKRVENSLIINGKVKEESNWIKRLGPFLKNRVMTHISLFNYKDAITGEGRKLYNQYVKGRSPKSDAIGDPRSWREKKGLRKLLEQPMYMNAFNPKPFDMTEKNPDIYFWDKIIEHQQGKKTLVFLTGVNEVLMKSEVTKPGYRENEALIDQYFTDKPVGYANFDGIIDEKLFTDHTHLTGEGYGQLAKLVWDKWMDMDKQVTGSNANGSQTEVK